MSASKISSGSQRGKREEEKKEREVEGPQRCKLIWYLCGPPTKEMPESRIALEKTLGTIF